MLQGNYIRLVHMDLGLDELHDTSTRCVHNAHTGRPRHRPSVSSVGTRGGTWSPIVGCLSEAHALYVAVHDTRILGIHEALRVLPRVRDLGIHDTLHVAPPPNARWKATRISSTPTRESLVDSHVIAFWTSMSPCWASTRILGGHMIGWMPTNVMGIHETCWRPREVLGIHVVHRGHPVMPTHVQHEPPHSSSRHHLRP